MIKVCIVGATGNVGSGVAMAITGSGDLNLVGAVARGAAGRRLSETDLNIKSDVVIKATLAEALENRPDVVVDYTSPLAVKDNVLIAL